MALPDNIKPPDPKRSVLGILAIGCGLLGLAAFFVLDYLAFVTEGQDTVSELAWDFLSWGPASYVLVVPIMLGVFGWVAMHLLGRGRWG